MKIIPKKGFVQLESLNWMDYKKKNTTSAASQFGIFCSHYLEINHESMLENYEIHACVQKCYYSFNVCKCASGAHLIKGLMDFLNWFLLGERVVETDAELMREWRLRVIIFSFVTSAWFFFFITIMLYEKSVAFKLKIFKLLIETSVFCMHQNHARKTNRLKLEKKCANLPEKYAAFKE